MKKKLPFKFNDKFKFFQKELLVGISLLITTCLSATTYTIGTGGTGGTSIATAITNYYAGATDSLVLQLISGYSESSVTISQVATAAKPIIIRPAATLSLSSVTWTLSGSYITVDGRTLANGNNYDLSIINTSTSGVPVTISGSNNTVKYVSLQGSNTSNTSGVVVVSGGSSNTIDNCEITSYNYSGTPSYSANSVYCAVAGANTLSNCKIHDIFSPSVDFFGVCLKTNASGWTITGNSFYNTVSTGASMTGNKWAYNINITSGSGYTITNNYFGGRSAQCGGSDTADKMLMGNTSSGFSYDFRHIYFECTGTTKNTINGNTFKNISFATQLSTGPYWGAIYVVNKANGASFDIKNNTIGSSSVYGNINVYWYGSESVGTQTVYGIYMADNSNTVPSNVDISGNTIGGISVTANPAVTGGAMGFGALIANTYGTINISSNNIGSPTVYNSIQNDFVGTTNRIGGSTSIISAVNGSSVAIQNNNIYNITAVSADWATFTGIGATGLGGNIISGNVLRNLKFRGDNKAIYNIYACIFMNATTGKSVNSVYNNTVYNVCNREKDANIAGIEVYNGSSTGTGGAKVYNNLIYNLQPYTASSGTYSTSGISVLGYKTNTNRSSDIYNNMIRLGTDTLGNAITGNYQIYGISELNRDNVTYNNIYNNTVYIMGTGATGTTTYSTAAFYGGVAPNAAREIKNNLFVNKRAAGSTDKHYSIYLSSSSNTTIDYNDYVSASNYIGALSGDKTTLNAWQTATSQDLNSLNVTPVFASAIAATPDLHLTKTLASNTGIIGKGTVISGVTTDYDGNTRNASNPGLGADEFSYNNWTGTGNWDTPANWTLGTPTSESPVVKIVSGTLTNNQTSTVSDVIVSPGAGLTNTGALTSTTLTINSDASGTGTFVDKGTATITSAMVNQYLASARNWYICAPVSGATVPTGSTYFGYSEPGDNIDLSVSGATAYWKPFAEGSTLTVGKGYIAQPGSTTTLSFNGTLNTGDITVNLTRTTGKTKEGFNLIANPYPSYVSLKSLAAGDSANLQTTYWIRSKTADGTSYVFDTYNFKGNVALNSGSGKALTGIIAPMQAFWVRVREGYSTGSLTFHNSFRSHIDDSNNQFRVKALSDQTLLRLQVSNGVHADETVIYTNNNASNELDDYDSQKMMNNSSVIPDLFTLVGYEQLAINGLNAFDGTEIPLGFSTLTAGAFSIKASEMTNIPDGTQLILKDYLDINNPVVTNLNDGSAYTFSSGVANSAIRFTISLKAKDISTSQPELLDGNWSAYVNNNHQIVVRAVKPGSRIELFNSEAKKLSSIRSESTTSVLTNQLIPGVYFVKMINDSYSSARRIIVP